MEIVMLVYVQVFDNGRWMTPLTSALTRFEFPLTDELQEKIQNAPRKARLCYSDTDEVVG
jgi:hypothetical protein